MAEIVTMAEEELRKRGKADAAELAAQVVAGSITHLAGQGLLADACWYSLQVRGYGV